MADNITVTPGAGATVKTESALDGVAQIQAVKISYSTEAKLSVKQINVSASGQNTLIAGVGGQVIKVYYGFLVVNGTVLFDFRDGATTSLNGAPFPLVINGSINLPMVSEPWLTTSSGNALTCNLSAAVTVTGVLFYTQA